MASSFFRLHPTLQHAITHDLGWRSLRPVQEQATAAILDGANAVVLAPTAGGKTEASMFPVLSRVLEESVAPVAALYICPIRALLNNQEHRIGQYCSMVGLSAFKWHGDVAASSRKRFLERPAHVLMTTPESLEVMLISQRVDAERLFANLAMVVIDEIHAFAGDERGAHLVAILERLSRFCGKDIQRIGLSATVGNPEVIGEWLQGSSKRHNKLINPPKPPTKRRLAIDFVEDVHALAVQAARVGAGKKSLVFVESRGMAERVAAAMAGRGIEVFVHHSAVSRADRRLAEERFAKGNNTAIVSTSTMELGIDIGDLDLVLQADAPKTVASLLQRMGRTGRRTGSVANFRMLCMSPESMLQGVALLQLMERGYIEDLQPHRSAARVLAHQVMALSLQQGGISRHRLFQFVAGAAGFSKLSEDDVQDIIDTMIDRDILYEADGRLSLGADGEARYGRRHFFELYSVFDTPNTLKVMHGKTEVGTVSAFFAMGAMFEDGPFCFRLGNRAWRATYIDDRRGLCHVVPAEAGRVPSWLGSPNDISYELCQEMKAVLMAGDVPVWLDAAGREELGDLRAGYAGLLEADTVPVEFTDDAIRWHTFAGGRANRLLASALEANGGGRWTPGNLSLKPRDAKGGAQVRDAVAAVLEIDDWDAEAARAAQTIKQADGKFDVCLPEGVLAQQRGASRAAYTAAAAVARLAAPALRLTITQDDSGDASLVQEGDGHEGF